MPRRKKSFGSKRARRSAGLTSAINAMPGTSYTRRKVALAEALGIRVQSLNHWKRVPRARLMAVHRASGISLEELAPDLYKPKVINKVFRIRQLASSRIA